MKFGSTGNDRPARSGDMVGYLGEGVEIKGDVRFTDTLRLDGKIHGKVQSDGELVVGPKGDLDGEITVGTLSISGRVHGTVRVKERLEIHAGGRIEGDVLLGRSGLIVHDGGIVEATIQMGANAPSQPAQKAPAGAAVPR